MIEFSLSKLNMLIFVTAVAAIVIFFIAAVNSNMRTRQSYELVYKIGKELKTGIESNSYCTAKFIDIPKTIKTNSGTADTFNLKYKLNISAYDLDGLAGDSQRIVLSIIERKSFKPRMYAAYSFDYNGAVRFYENKEGCNVSEFGTNGCKIDLNTENTVEYDPFKLETTDTQILFAKTIDNGKPTVYLIPCVLKNGLYSCTYFLTNEQEGQNYTLKQIIPCLDAITNLITTPEVNGS